MTDAATATATRLAPALRLWPLAAIPVVVAAVVLAIVYMAAALALSRDAGPLRNAIALAFQDGALPGHRVAIPDRRTGAFTYNDCVILIMAVNTAQPLIEKVVSPALIEKRSDPGETDACLMLRDLVVEGHVSDYGNWPYHRYISAFVPVTAAAVPAFGLEGWRLVLLVANYAAVAALGMAGAVGWTRRRRAGRRARATDIGAMVASVVFLLFSGMDFYAQNLSIGLAEPLVYGWMALLAFGRPLAWSTSRFVLVTAVTFAAIFAFEFWTGQVPVAAAAGVAFLGLSMQSTRDLVPTLRRSVLMLVSAGVAMGAMLALKITVASLVFRQNVLADVTGQLEVRVGDASFGVPGLLLRLAGRADHIGQGSLILGLAAGLAAVGAGAAGLGRLAAVTPGDPWRALARRQAGFVAASALMILAWHLVFRNHSSIHSEFMVRTFAWVWTACTVLFGLSLGRARFVTSR